MNPQDRNKDLKVREVQGTVVLKNIFPFVKSQKT